MSYPNYLETEILQQDPRKTAGQTKRRNTRLALIGAANYIFPKKNYQFVQVDDIAELSGRSKPTFYTMFDSKAEWGIAVINKYLEEPLANLQNSKQKPALNFFDRLAVFESTVFNLPGITQALVEKRMTSGASFSTLTPELYGTMHQIVESSNTVGLSEYPERASSYVETALDAMSVACAVRSISTEALSTSATLSVVRSYMPLNNR